MVRMSKSFWLIAPFATWIAMMTVLPATTWAYATRTVAVALLLALGLGIGLKTLDFRHELCLSSHVLSPLKSFVLSLKSSILPGLVVGLAVFAIWILPEQFDWAWYRKWCIIGEGGTQAVAEASTLMIVYRLIGSAFVISVAEELFFRKWLIGFAGFWPTVALFAVEHDRWLVAAICGIAYGWLYLRRGLGAAIVAHVTTNLVLGLWVLKTGQWQFW